MRVSVIATVLNESASIEELLASLACQTRQPDEVIIVDGGSTDGTQERLARWSERLPLQLIVLPGANIAQGRNTAIAAATGDVIAVTDAGVRLAEQWLAELTEPFEKTPPPDVVAGFFEPAPRTLFELAMGATVLPAVADIRAERFLPSSRSVAFRRESWQAAGGYPEWLDYCEDLVFDLRLKAQGARFVWAPRAIAHYRPRSSLTAFFRQYYLYARGDGKAGLWTARHLIRYATYCSLPWLGRLAWQRPLLGAVVALAAAAYVRRPYQRLRPALPQLSATEAAAAVALVPVIRLTGDVAKMLGYPAGLCWRLSNGRRR